ncbi:trimeric intracellular cation channel family protein [Risungbinella massiliensis]|uniref:trimeric intracellular cation channel family protein n=1 Tax=Risungbinella massiliensis TaxID=1329796 RepID=UPI0005CBE892|nr:trimeric intracellular cation channel family protein [Risungbinella massiliensis]
MWEIFTFLGTIAFAVSGALVAFEEKYDLIGVYVLGFVTAFGGGVIRNLLIGVPVSQLWQQETLILVALISITILFFIPKQKIRLLHKSILFSDAVGLAAFSIQGAIVAAQTLNSIFAIMFAALITGAGGGMIRDVLAGRKPLIFHQEIYATWCLLGGIAVYFGGVASQLLLWIAFGLIIVLRMISLERQWQLPVITKS